VQSGEHAHDQRIISRVAVGAESTRVQEICEPTPRTIASHCTALGDREHRQRMDQHATRHASCQVGRALQVQRQRLIAPAARQSRESIAASARATQVFHNFSRAEPRAARRRASLLPLHRATLSCWLPLARGGTPPVRALARPVPRSRSIAAPSHPSGWTRFEVGSGGPR